VRLFEVGGDPANTQFLFLGDYVDRGCFSTECIFYLYALKITYPATFSMLRGNHECRQLTAFFNFKDECTYKYDEEIYDAIMTSFDYLPLAAIVNNTFFCVHGGLSPDVTTIKEIARLDRVQEVPREGPMCDLLWSDPYEPDKEAAAGGDGAAAAPAQSQHATDWFGYNETRQCSYVYGIEAVKQFLADHKLTSVIRAHEAQVDGFKMSMVNKKSGIPRVITIFSAPNYCDVYRNKAACLKFDTNVLNIKQFVDSAHPYYLPNFMDVFQWSLPFVAEKVTDMLAAVLSSADLADDDGNVAAPSDAANPVIPNEKKGMLKKKVLAVTKLMRMYKMLRQENETIVQLKQLTPNNRIPFGLLSGSGTEIKKALTDFSSAKTGDKPNEARPTPESIEAAKVAATAAAAEKLEAATSATTPS
jgi:serine/threonine-protein phosphatase 2B catalytic subunit